MTLAEMDIKIVDDIITRSNYGDDAAEEEEGCIPGTFGM